MYNPYTLEGKKILITGASSGIGRAVAVECSKAGACVIVTGRNKERLDETMKLLSGSGHEMIVSDFTSPDDVEQLLNNICTLDGFVGNAGYTRSIPVEFTEKEELQNIFNVNAQVNMMLVAGMLRNKKLKKGASLVFTSSISGNLVAYKGGSMYAASKAAISGYVKAAAIELARRKIRVNAVCPGMIDTHVMGDEFTEEQLKEDARRYPLKRYGRPEEVAYGIMFLLSDAASFITGTNLIIDGGYTVNY